MNDLQLLERNVPKTSYTPYPSEVLAKTRMMEYGIYADLGKETPHRYADVVAWGGIVLECRLSNWNQARKRYQFRVRSNHGDKRYRAHLFVLMCQCGNYITYHVFPPTHPTFYKPDGEMKRAVIYSPYATSHREQYGQPLTHSIMMQQQDAWHLVEAERQALRFRLQEAATAALQADALQRTTALPAAA